jgi:hypothetical protein
MANLWQVFVLNKNEKKTTHSRKDKEMKQIAVINGIAVFSDKSGGISINNSRIVFADGSSCDVRTKSIDNRGPGRIRLGEENAPEDEERITKGPTRYPTVNLRITDIVANIVVEVWDRADTELTLSGPKKVVEGVRAEVHHALLNLMGQGPTITRDSRSTVSIRNMSIGSMVASSGNVTVESGDDSNELAVTVSLKVPHGANVRLNGSIGDVRIGDTDGELSVDCSGAGKIRCGSIRAASLEVLGSTKIHISSVNGPLSAKMTGSGKIKVKSGRVTALSVQNTGSGDFDLNGEADTATLSVTGSGNINVARVNSKPVKHCTGSGEINIG